MKPPPEIIPNDPDRDEPYQVPEEMLPDRQE